MTKEQNQDWKTLANDLHGYTDLNADEFIELIEEAENVGMENLYPILFKEATDACRTSEDYRILGDYATQMVSKDLARSLYKKAEEKATTVDDLKYLLDSVRDNDYLGDQDWGLKLEKKINEGDFS